MFTKILVGIDGRQGGRDALALARVLGGPEAQVVLAHVWEHADGVMAVATGAEHPAEAARAMLDHERREAGIECRIAVQAAGSAAAGLHALAVQEAASLLVVGASHTEGAGRVLLGDTTRAALHGVPCAVAVSPHNFAADVHHLHRVGVGFREDPAGEEALRVARAVATASGAQLRALAALDPLPPMWAPPLMAYAEVLTDLEAGGADRIRSHLREAGVEDVVVTSLAPVTALRGLSGEVDLLVLGSRGYGPARRLLLGSTSDALAREAACAVLIVPRPDGELTVVDRPQDSLATGA